MNCFNYESKFKIILMGDAGGVGVGERGTRISELVLGPKSVAMLENTFALPK